MDRFDLNGMMPGWRIVSMLRKEINGVTFAVEKDPPGSGERAALRVLCIPRDEDEPGLMLADSWDEDLLRTAYEKELEQTLEVYRLLNRLGPHPNLLQPLDLSSCAAPEGLGFRVCIRTELLPPLHEAAQYRGDPVIAACRVGMDICAALEACGKAQLIHGSIQPGSIFVAPEGTCRLGGFDPLANRPQSYPETLPNRFVAPEAFRNWKSFGPEADLYSLGMILYWLLNERRLPFVSLSPAAPALSVMDEALMRRYRGDALPPPAHGSEALKRIVLKACAYDPRDRYPSAEEMRRDLAALDPGRRICTVCGSLIPAGSPDCPVCRERDPYPDVDERGRRGRWHEDLQHCRGCGKTYHEEEDRFCRYCGARRTEEAGRWFEVSPDDMEVLYGPMPIRLHYACGGCGHTWEGSNWDPERFCPRCGAAVSGKKEGEERTPEPPGPPPVRGKWIAVLAGEGRERFELRPEPGSGGILVLGRAAAGKKLLRNITVSRRHLQVEVLEGKDKELILTDLSRNGTFFNDRRLEKDMPELIWGEGILRLGNRDLRLLWIEDTHG